MKIEDFNEYMQYLNETNAFNVSRGLPIFICTNDFWYENDGSGLGNLSASIWKRDEDGNTVEYSVNPSDSEVSGLQGLGLGKGMTYTYRDILMLHNILNIYNEYDDDKKLSLYECNAERLEHCIEPYFINDKARAKFEEWKVSKEKRA